MRIATATSALAMAGIFSVGGAAPASAATHDMSATVYGATYRANVYHPSDTATTFSGVLNDTARTNGYRATLQWRSQVVNRGSSRIVTSLTAYQSTTTSVRVSSGIYASRYAKQTRIQYRVCSRTCSIWRATPWRSM